MKTLRILLILLITLSDLEAQTISWVGDIPGDGISWNDPWNWSAFRVPNANDIVGINGDSVVVNTDVTIKQLIVGAGGILYQVSPNNNIEFIVQQSTGQGVELENDGKLYLNGEFQIINSANNGLYLDALSTFIGMPSGLLIIDDCNQDGIKSISGAVFSNNGATIIIQNHSGDGIDLTSFNNAGKIQVTSGGVSGAEISGSTGENSGIFQVDGGLTIQTSSLFTNTASGEIKCTEDGMALSSNFDNYGDLVLENTTGNNLYFSSSGKVFNNYDNVIFRNTSSDNVFLGTAATIYNHSGASFRYLPNLLPPLNLDVFGLVIQDADTRFINEGLASFDMRSKREGVKAFGRGMIINSGEFNISRYYKKGLISDPYGLNDTLLYNTGEGQFFIDQAVVSDGIALEMRTRNRLYNAPCADLVIQDSLYMSGIGLAVQNEGYMEIEKFEITSNVSFNNAGALFIADTSLADGGPAGYLNDFTNTGLVYHPLRGPLILNTTVTPVFPLYNAANLNRPINAIYFKADNNGSLANCGMYFEGSNTWAPCQYAIDSDTAYFEFQNQGSPCNIRMLTLPFVTPPVWDCSSSPPVTVTFTGAISEDWHTAGNWSNNEIPRPCDSVIIPHETKCTIFSGMTATAKTILVQDKAVFETNNNVVLTVDPNYP
ncbi:hypothetical protein [Jiulongibacter sediminis]|uniref:hypothetical protein n=1 Tax=Jiulongibacter sediminis TaxID=1605367 RepID=UPI0026F37C30|nr:hypothetical protein [Jiulongibacter sediminis]